MAKKDSFYESWAYQEMVEEGVVKGLERGREQLRQALIGIVQARFPQIIEQTKKQVAQINDGEQLQKMIVNVSIARDASEAAQVLSLVSSNG